jgi:hypothetical protein
MCVPMFRGGQTVRQAALRQSRALPKPRFAKAALGFAQKNMDSLHAGCP